jgi:hypothetical protein
MSAFVLEGQQARMPPTSASRPFLTTQFVCGEWQFSGPSYCYFNGHCGGAKQTYSCRQMMRSELKQVGDNRSPNDDKIAAAMVVDREREPFSTLGKSEPN